VKTLRRALLLSTMLAVASCDHSSDNDGGAPPAPPGPTAPVISGPSSPLPAATLGVAISPITFTAAGQAPFAWSITAGALPAGVTLSAAGVLTGTPTALGNFSFTLTVTDANGTDSDPYTWSVGNTVAESEPNDTAASATPVAIGMASTGVIIVDDIDFWSFSATEGQVIQIEIFGIRREFDSWDANANRPRVNLIGPNGTDFLVGHDFDSAGTAGWQWGDHDLDIPLFRIPADGDYFVRITPYVAGVQGGSYVMLVTDVTPGSLQTESEDNDDVSTADPITPGMVLAVKQDDDDDFFSFDITEPTLVYFELTAYRNGIFGSGGAPDDDYVDLTIELIDADQSFVRATNYRVFFNDPALHYHLVTSGTYYLRVTEAVGGAEGDGEYYITFTATPVGSIVEAESNDDASTATPIAYGDVASGDINGGEVDFYSFSGTAGDIVRVFWFEAGASETASDFLSLSFMIDDVTLMQRAITTTSVNGLACMRAILPSTGTFYVRVQPDGGFTTYVFRFELFKDATFETEANDTLPTANAIPGSGRVAGAINASGDVDVFSFTLVANEVATFSIYAGPGSSSNGFSSHAGYTTAFAALLPDLEVVNSSGTSLGVVPYSGTASSGESVTNGIATSEITVVAPSAGTYYIRVAASDNNGSDDHRYVLEKR